MTPTPPKPKPRPVRRTLSFAWSLTRFFTKTTLTLLFVASLALNIATVTITGVYTAVSGAVSAIGASTVLARSTARAAAQVTTQRATVRATRRTVSRRVARGAARSGASAFAEAVPLIGAGAIAVTVALDVADACATARDMAALERSFLPDEDFEPFSCTDEFAAVMDETTMDSVLDYARAAPGLICGSARDYAASGVTEDLPPWAGDAIQRAVAVCPNEDTEDTE